MAQGEVAGDPPARPNGEMEDGTEAAVPCDNWILASIYSWVRGGRTKEAIVEKVMPSFDTKELRAAAALLRSGGWCVPQVQVPQEGTPDYSRRLAETVVGALFNIRNAAPLKVQFWVSAGELYRVPGVGAFPDNLSQPAVSARLGDVDTKLQLVLDRLATTENLEHTVAGLARTVTNLQEQLRGQQQEQHRRQVQEDQEEEAAAAGNWTQGRTKVTKAASPPVVQQPKPTYADRVRGQIRPERARSASNKRGRAGSDPGQ